MQSSLNDHKYNESELISFKISLNTPYINNSKDFDEVEGNIDIDGINYQYVKKRVYNDTLEILCIPNYTKTNIKIKKDDFAKQINDIASSGNSKKSPTTKTLKATLSDFIDGTSYPSHTSLNLSKLDHKSNHNLITSFDFLQRLDQPPEA